MAAVRVWPEARTRVTVNSRPAIFTVVPSQAFHLVTNVAKVRAAASAESIRTTPASALETVRPLPNRE